MSVLLVDRVTFSWSEERLLEELSLEIPKGGIAGVVGPSGCGKSTLLRLVADRTLELAGGEVLLAGVPASSYPRPIGVLFQDLRLIPWRTVLGNLEMGESFRASDDRRDGDLEELIGLLGLEEHLWKYPAELSGGLRERTALGRALALGPEVLLLDEPLGSTDYSHRLEIEDYLFDLIRKQNACCAFVTHDLEQAVALADRIMLLPTAGSGRNAEVIEVVPALRALRPSLARMDALATQQLGYLLDRYRRLL